MLNETSSLNINVKDGNVNCEDNFVPFVTSEDTYVSFDNKNINKELLQSVHNNNILDINSNSNILLASSILRKRRNKKDIKKRVSFHESILNMDSKVESDDPPREVRIRHSWHADDVGSEENSNSVANFWAMFSLESNPWSSPDPSEIGQEVFVEDTMYNGTAHSSKLTYNIQRFFDALPKMSETNINVNKDQLLTRVDKVFESIKTKIEPCAEGEIPMESRSFYWASESDLMSKEVCEVGKMTTTPAKRQSFTSTNASSTPNQWSQSKVCPKALLVKKFLKSIPPIKKTPKSSTLVLKCSSSVEFKFKILSISKQMKQKAVDNFHEELNKLSTMNDNDKCRCPEEVALNGSLENKFRERLHLTQDDYIFKVYKILNQHGQAELLFITKRQLILMNVDNVKQNALSLRDLKHVFVSELAVTFECKGATRNLTVICCIDVGFVSTLISNVEIMCLKQKVAPSSVSAKPKEDILCLLRQLSKQTQYFKETDEVVLSSWSWVEQFSDITKTGLEEVQRSGNLMYKVNEKSTWTPGFVSLVDGVLTVKESPLSLKNISVILCHSFCQVNDSTRPYTFKVHFNPYSFVLLAAADETQLFNWLQDIMISIKINDSRYHGVSSPIREENVSGNYCLVSATHIICYKHPLQVDLVVPLQQVSSFKLSKTCDYCVMELNCLEASEDELLHDVAFHFISKSQLEKFTEALLSLRYFKVSDDLLLHEQMLNSTNKKLKRQWDKYLSTRDF